MGQAPGGNPRQRHAGTRRFLVFVPEIIIRAAARREMIKAGRYLEEHAGSSVTDRFVASLADTFDELARMPRMAPLCGFTRPAIRQLRRWPVRSFENWLIFYRARRNAIEIIHVMHGARDIERLLGE